MAEQGSLDRLPPHSRDAERSALGSMLRDNAVIGDVVQIIREDNFYTDAHQKIYKGIIALYDKGHPADLVTLADWLKEQKFIEDVGGYAYLAELWDASPTAANAEYYARIVRGKALVRNLIHASTEILRDAYDQGMPADELLEGAERKILDIAQMGIVGEMKTLKDALGEAFNRIDARSQNEQMSISGLPTGYLDLDEKTAGFQNSELILIAARPSVGKCLAFDSEITLDDGSIATIEEVYRQRQGRLLTLNDDWRFRFAMPSAFVDDGCKPVYRVTTRLGRVIETTLSHPFLTIHGWQPLAEVRAGDAIAVPRRIDVFGQETMRDCEVKLLAYFIGDGCLTDTTPEFTNTNPDIQDDFTGAIAAFGAVKVRREDTGGMRAMSFCVASDPAFFAAGRREFGLRLRGLRQTRLTPARQLAHSLGVSPALVCRWEQGVCAPAAKTFSDLCTALDVAAETLVPRGLAAIRQSGKNPLTRWLQEHALWGKPARNKFVPQAIFKLQRHQLSLFLNRLFATDGWATVLSGGNPQLGYSTVSERLARQIQHLLLRFGIIAGLRRRTVKYKDSRRVAWQVDITDQLAIRTFITSIGIFGKETAVARVAEALEGRNHQTNCDLIPRAIWDRLAAAKGKDSWCAVARRAGLRGHTNIHVGRRDFSRRRLRKLAVAVHDEELQRLADSEVYWDRIVCIEPVGLKQVYDLTIPNTHNFVANDICVHNTAFACNVIRHMAVEGHLPVFLVSLEQSRIELAERLLCCQARVDSHKLRTGRLNSDDLQKLFEAGDQLSNAKLFIDDTPAQNMLHIAANARRLKLRNNIRIVFIDYLQLIEPDNRRDSRQEQVANISRRLKFLARELLIPVVALAQVNRSSEDRQDHRPRLADLRESGCLTGETLITLASTGARLPIRELVGKSGFQVWALDEVNLKLQPATVSHAFCTGRKPVFRLETRLGRVIRATGNHRFRTVSDWVRLDQLTLGQRIALPRNEPTGRMGRLVHAVGGDPLLAALADSDVYWDEVRSITPDGEEEVFDLTIPGPANFVANGFIVHNSLEQDADTVMMLHRPELHEPGQHEGVIEVIVAKQRNGPTGEVTLTYLKQFMRFENFAVEAPFGYGGQ